jgi:hypothetical protein
MAGAGTDKSSLLLWRRGILMLLQSSYNSLITDNILRVGLNYRLGWAGGREVLI